jgi:hypothetical protein
MTITGNSWTTGQSSSETSTLHGSWGRVVGGSFAMSSVSTLMVGRGQAPWLVHCLEQLMDEGIRNGVPVKTITAAMRWISSLPAAMPAPFVGAGSDETISLEWQRGPNILHVMFDRDGAEIYFAGGNGDEWETRLEHASDKLDAALRAIAGPAA